MLLEGNTQGNKKSVGRYEVILVRALERSDGRVPGAMLGVATKVVTQNGVTLLWEGLTRPTCRKLTTMQRLLMQGGC